MQRKILFVILISTFFIAGFAHAQCGGGDIELCIAIDGSGSVAAADFNTQKEGLAQAIEDPTVVPQDGSVTISVVQFGNGAPIAIGATVIDSQATADNVAAQIRAIQQLSGGTPMAAAIDSCMGQFIDPTKKWVIDISTDGFPNSQTATITARDNAVAAGLDVLNALGVGPGVGVAFLESLVWPQPASPPFDPGFVVLVTNFDEYVTAVREKIQAEVCPSVAVPTMNEWGMIIFMVLAGLGSLYYLRKRTV